LIFIFGEIVYGGHIVNDIDRILANAYLKNMMVDELFDDLELFPYLDPKMTHLSFKVTA
jgi:dynein heavy chain